MRRLTTLAVTAAIAAASVAAPAFAAPRAYTPKVGAAVPGYYVIRWDNSGICQIWNEQLQTKPKEWPSTYKVLSKPVSTFNEASQIQMDLRTKRTCTL